MVDGLRYIVLATWGVYPLAYLAPSLIDNVATAEVVRQVAEGFEQQGSARGGVHRAAVARTQAVDVGQSRQGLRFQSNVAGGLRAVQDRMGQVACAVGVAGSDRGARGEKLGVRVGGRHKVRQKESLAIDRNRSQRM